MPKTTPTRTRKPSLAGVANITAAKTESKEAKKVITAFVDEIKINYPDPVERMQFLLKNFS